MIKKNYKEGDLLNVADLNKITVLFDRGVSEKTEVGHNEWRPHLDGPPHFHDEKEQVFYVTSGEGIVRLGTESHPVKKGCLVYIPAGLQHQTITTGDEPLCYLLMNLYESSENKTFAEHIETVREIRAAQARSQSSGAPSTIVEVRHPHKIFNDIMSGLEKEDVYGKTIVLVDRLEAERLELGAVKVRGGSQGETPADPNEERTLFALSGSGQVQVGEETGSLSPGDVVFAPAGQALSVESLDEELLFLCLTVFIGETNRAANA